MGGLILLHGLLKFFVLHTVQPDQQGLVAFVALGAGGVRGRGMGHQNGEYQTQAGSDR